jgi:hypothetical protein
MPTAKKSRLPIRVYQLRIEIADIKPCIWRTILVPDTVKLSKLDRIIQAVFGWTNSHLHEFKIGSKLYGMVDPEEDLDWDERSSLLDERKYTVGSVLCDDLHDFEYEYDFGDGWRHLIKVERTLAPDQTNDWPMCIAGANACPPEDVGGPLAYAGFVEIMSNPHHAEYLEMFCWHGGPFDPSGFDVNSANARLKRLR